MTTGISSRTTRWCSNPLPSLRQLILSLLHHSIQNALEYLGVRDQLGKIKINRGRYLLYCEA